jgi:hypothetical protein
VPPEEVIDLDYSTEEAFTFITDPATKS